jgi:hypothetical protein
VAQALLLALLPAALRLPSAQASEARPGRAARGGVPRSGDAARTSACATQSHIEKDNLRIQNLSLSGKSRSGRDTADVSLKSGIGLRMTEQRRHKARIVREAIKNIEAELETSSKIKPPLADLIRLLQIEKELAADEPREVRMRWIESNTTDPPNGE